MNMEELLTRKESVHKEYLEVCRSIVNLKLKDVIDKFKDIIPNEPQRIGMEFNWEWNDEDGTDPHIGNVWASDKDGNYIELDDEEQSVKKKSKYSDYVYDCTLSEYIRDEIYDAFDLRELLETFNTRYELEIELN